MEIQEKIGTYFHKLEIQNFRCFKDMAVLKLSDDLNQWKKWTIILGDNGTGKTSLLQILSCAEVESIGEINAQDKNYHIRFKGSFVLFQGKGNLKTSTKTEADRGVAHIYISSNQAPNRNEELRGDFGFDFASNTILGSYYYGGEARHSAYQRLKCYGYGANRFMSLNTLADSTTNNSETLFNEDAKLINAEEWYLQIDYAASKESDVQAFAVRKREQVRQILLDILPDIEDLRVTEPTKENLKQTVEFKTPYGWVTIHQLSLGYKTMVAWMVDLAARMFDRYPDSINPLTEPAIVLIDEIDLHLHPKWQRKIFRYLDEKFPATQFIVTAHSPLVVQSAPNDANIVLLRRDGDHVIIDQDIKSVHSWRLDQILSSDLFGVGSRSPEIEVMMEERTNLLQKGNLSDKEQLRLKVLNDLAHNLPTAESLRDIEAMEIIRRAADHLKSE